MVENLSMARTMMGMCKATMYAVVQYLFIILVLIPRKRFQMFQSLYLHSEEAFLNVHLMMFDQLTERNDTGLAGCHS